MQGNKNTLAVDGQAWVNADDVTYIEFYRAPTTIEDTLNTQHRVTFGLHGSAYIRWYFSAAANEPFSDATKRFEYAVEYLKKSFNIKTKV